MEIKLFKNWWLLTLKGVLSIIFGLFLLIVSKWTKDQNRILIGIKPIIIFGIIVVISGILLVYGAITHRRSNSESKFWLMEGIFDVLVGGTLFVFIIKFIKHPVPIRYVFHYIIIFWISVMGILQIISAIRLKKLMENWWVLLFTGIISIMFSVLIFIDPFTSRIINLMVIAFFIIILGILFVVISKNMKNVYTKDSTT